MKLSKLALKRHCNPEIVGKVHCECLLVKHFHALKNAGSSPWSNIPPFSYIGVSKLSCQGCDTWFKVYNALTGSSFSTGGTHAKWCFPWGMPDLELGDKEMELMKEYMADDTARVYCWYQKEKGRMVLLSDSIAILSTKNILV